MKEGGNIIEQTRTVTLYFNLNQYNWVAANIAQAPFDRLQIIHVT